MFIEKEGLKELVEKRIEIKVRLEAIKDKVSELSNEIKKLQSETFENEQTEFKNVNEQINRMALMEVWDTLKDTEMPGEFIIKDDKPFCTIVDITSEIKEQAKKAKEDWIALLSEDTE